MSGNKQSSVSLPEDSAAADEHAGPRASTYLARALEQCDAMDKLGEIVTDYTTNHDPISKGEIDAARAALRHDRCASTSAT